MEKLLKKLDKQKSATSRRTTLQAIHNVRYRKLTTDQRNKLSTTTTTKAKAAEAELRALNRLVSGSVKKSKYQKKYTDEQRQRIKAIREAEKQAKEKAREEAKEQRRKEKETLERIKENRRRGREELHRKREEERKAKEEAKRLKEEAKRLEEEAKEKELQDLGFTHVEKSPFDDDYTPEEVDPESLFNDTKSIEKDILKDLENIRKKVSQLTDYDLKYAHEKSFDEANYGETTILQDIHDIIQESINNINSRYDLLKTIAEYKGIDVENNNILRQAISGEMNFQETWLIETYMANGNNGTYGKDHAPGTAANASAIANILQYLSELMENMPQNIVDEYHRYLDRITDITIFRIQYDTYVASSGINEVHSIITNYNENLNEMIQNPSYDIYKQNVDEYTSDWISEQEWEERMKEFRS